MASDMFMTDKEKEICEALDGLIAPCDAELTVYGGRYTLKTGTLENLATAATFFRDAVDDKKNTSIPHIVIEVDTSRISELVCEAQACIDRVVEDIRIGHFTDGGTSKESVKIIPKQRQKFVDKLIAMAKAKTKLTDEQFDTIKFAWDNGINFAWDNGINFTRCKMVLDDARLSYGVATKHPGDVENEYIEKSLSFNRAFDKLEKAVLGIGDEKVVGTALTMALEDNYVNVGRNGFITRCITGADVDIGDAVYVGHGGCVYPANSQQKGYRGGRIEDSKTNAEKVVAGFDFATDEIVYMDTDSCLWKPKIKFETKSESMPNLTPIHDDITITMTREQAEDVLKTLKDNPGNINTYWDLHEKMGV